MVTRPKVRPDATVDFDHHSDAFNLNELAVNAELRQRCPVAWNENYDGFWYLSSYDAVSHTARDGDTFAHKYEPHAPDGVDYQGEMGVPRPDGQPALGIGEVDGPYHQALRHALAPFFSPGAVDKLKPFMEQSAHWFLDQQIATGQMDLVLDYASPVPAILTMKLMGLPYDNWHLYANLFHSVMAVPQDSAEYTAAIAKVPAMMQEVIEFATARRSNPEDDLTSFLLQFEFDGHRLTDEQLLNILWNLIGGGVDTTTSQTALTLRHLGTTPTSDSNSSTTPSSTAPPPTNSCATSRSTKPSAAQSLTTSSSAANASARTTKSSSAGSRPTTTKPNSTGPTKSSSIAHPTATSPSGWARTAASDRTSPG
ncbi:hypothetical protein MTIM_12760 [Mycobacterium timonense]|uniref:Cytochrome P450 n=1 Tax=Mycobacterium timonense TaxID=701043 RepID=A0A7I9Z3W2_9MYCO|nr:hypothetical protein MTIM_12760 [Mycobacterium timonense]